MNPLAASDAESAPLLEREHELASLTARADATGRGEGALVVIAGAAGTGKSTLLAALAVCDLAGEQAQIKWPNDIVLARGDGLAKLAGILAEGRPQEGWAILGIGVNVAVAPTDLPAELHATAATLGRDLRYWQQRRASAEFSLRKP